MGNMSRDIGTTFGTCSTPQCRSTPQQPTPPLSQRSQWRVQIALHTAYRRPPHKYGASSSAAWTFSARPLKPECNRSRRRPAGLVCSRVDRSSRHARHTAQCPICGAAGTSIAGTVWNNRTALHHVRLTEQASVNNPLFNQQIGSTQPLRLWCNSDASVFYARVFD